MSGSHVFLIVLLSFSVYLGDLLFIGLAIGSASVDRLSKNSELVVLERQVTRTREGKLISACFGK